MVHKIGIIQRLNSCIYTLYRWVLSVFKPVKTNQIVSFDDCDGDKNQCWPLEDLCSSRCFVKWPPFLWSTVIWKMFMVVMLLASHAWQHARDRCARGQIEMYKCKLGDRRQIFIHLTLHAKAESCNAAMKHVRARMHTRAHLPAGVSHQHVPFKAEPRLFIHIYIFCYSTYSASSLTHFLINATKKLSPSLSARYVYLFIASVNKGRLWLYGKRAAC